MHLLQNPVTPPRTCRQPIFWLFSVIFHSTLTDFSCLVFSSDFSLEVSTLVPGNRCHTLRTEYIVSSLVLIRAFQANWKRLKLGRCCILVVAVPKSLAQY
ncbi:hypothetical protein VNO78_23930 [Psophocarpus tetragonolobus]|uniref:Uncharacterized protein n=1 Tax=Psophocarpus tetragonolobus TaxID=3891 RepID=A0AAN9XE18_PSOTE